MLADLFPPQPDHDPRAYDHAFIEEVHVSQAVPRDARVERFILICWVLIAIKHVAIIWLVHHYRVPFHQLWVNAPTWLLGVVATVLYRYGHE